MWDLRCQNTTGPGSSPSTAVFSINYSSIAPFCNVIWHWFSVPYVRPKYQGTGSHPAVRIKEMSVEIQVIDNYLTISELQNCFLDALYTAESWEICPYGSRIGSNCPSLFKTLNGVWFVLRSFFVPFCRNCNTSFISVRLLHMKLRHICEYHGRAYAQILNS
jgi:hypothetical protein